MLGQTLLDGSELLLLQEIGELIDSNLLGLIVEHLLGADGLKLEQTWLAIYLLIAFPMKTKLCLQILAILLRNGDGEHIASYHIIATCLLEKIVLQQYTGAHAYLARQMRPIVGDEIVTIL